MDEQEGNAMSLPMRHTKVDVGTSSNSSSGFTNSEASNAKWGICRICEMGIDLVNYVLIGCLTIFTLCYSLSSFNTLNLHATLCTIGYVLLMSVAIVVFIGDSVVTKFLTHRAKRHVHWILQVLGVVCIVSGVILMYRVKERHFQSTHAILGIASVAVMLFLIAFGYPVFIAVKLRNMIRPTVIKFCHNFLGLGCFAIGMASQCYGYKKFRAMKTSSNEDLRLICIVIVVVITVLSVRKALPALCRQFALLFRRTSS